MIYLCSLTTNLTDLQTTFSVHFHSHKSEAETYFYRKELELVCVQGSAYYFCLKCWVKRADLKDTVDLHVLNIELYGKCVKSGLWILHQPNPKPFTGVYAKAKYHQHNTVNKQNQNQWKTLLRTHRQKQKTDKSHSISNTKPHTFLIPRLLLWKSYLEPL